MNKYSGWCEGDLMALQFAVSCKRRAVLIIFSTLLLHYRFIVTIF